jgi:hypothetical protein
VVRTGTYHQGIPFKLEIGEGASVDVAPAAGRSRAAFVRNKRCPHVEAAKLFHPVGVDEKLGE